MSRCALRNVFDNAIRVGLAPHATLVPIELSPERPNEVATIGQAEHQHQDVRQLLDVVRVAMDLLRFAEEMGCNRMSRAMRERIALPLVDFVAEIVERVDVAGCSVVATR